MGKPTGFIELGRKGATRRPVAERVMDHGEVYLTRDLQDVQAQASRCMDCGIPFCHQGCPLGNLIPEWNDFAYRGHWDEALARLYATNNFPEFTGKLCPAPCEAACVLGIADDAVTIKDVELRIIEQGLANGGLAPLVSAQKSGRRVAIIGSGPAGLAAAQQLARAGHDVTVFERADRIGGLLRYGIPDFKMDKALLDQRLEQLRAEGVQFRTSCEIGRDISGDEIARTHDAICVTIGATKARALSVPGSDARGVHFAMAYLEQQNRVNAGEVIAPEQRIDARGKNVIILGGGDTGADCLGTAHRQGAAHITQLEISPRPPERRQDGAEPWPLWPTLFRTSAAHEEGGERAYALMTTRVIQSGGAVTGIEVVEVTREANGALSRRDGTERVLPCDLLLLAMGFTGAESGSLAAELGVAVDGQGRIAADENGRTSVPHVFAAGDARRGASLIVWAIAEGRRMSKSVEAYFSASFAAQ